MAGNKSAGKKKTVVIIVNNEIAFKALKSVAAALGYEVRQDIESCGRAEFGIIDAYFAFFGIVQQIRSANPGLPLVMVVSGGNDLGALYEPYFKDIFDVIRVDSYSQAQIKEKVSDWFSNGLGQFVTKARSAENHAARNR
jgi:hypothetical protein